MRGNIPVGYFYSDKINFYTLDTKCSLLGFTDSFELSHVITQRQTTQQQEQTSQRLVPQSPSSIRRPQGSPYGTPQSSGMKPKFLSLLRSSQLIRGATAYFESGQVSGVPTPTIIWSRLGKTIQNSAKYIITVNPSSSIQSLQVVDVTDSDEGEYTCTAVNQFGEDSTTAYLLASDKYADWVQQDRKRRPSVPRGMSPSPRQSPVPDYQAKRLRTRPASAERSSSDRDQASVDREEPQSERAVRGLPPLAHSSFRPQSAPPGARRIFTRTSESSRMMVDYPISDADISFQGGAESPQLDYFGGGGGFDTPEPTLMDHAREGSPSGSREAPRFVQSLASVRCAEGDQVQLRARISGFPKPRVSQRMPPQYTECHSSLTNICCR